MPPEFPNDQGGYGVGMKTKHTDTPDYPIPYLPFVMLITTLAGRQLQKKREKHSWFDGSSRS